MHSASRKVVIAFATMLLLAAGGSVLRLSLVWPWPWAQLLHHPDALPLEQAAVQVAVLPELAVAALAGGLLALASAALQQIVHNTLASDSTLAVASGAQLALIVATLFVPSAGLFGSFWVAFAGAVLAMLLVLFIARASEMNPVTMILGGLIVNMVFGAVAAVLREFYNDLLLGIMVWGSGSLLQDGWAIGRDLAWAALAVGAAFATLRRPLNLLSLDDEQARRLGAPVDLLRYAVLALAAATTALVVSKVGIISFIGLAGASVVNLLRIRHVGARLVAAFASGALLLLITNNAIAVVGRFFDIILPTGALTGVLGVPLLLHLVLRQRKAQHEEAQAAAAAPQYPCAPLRRLQGWRWPLAGALALAALCVLLQGFSANLHGWGWLWDGSLIARHRLPRSLSALATGAMLAVGGALLQIITRNPMASPEVLGISSGAALAVMGAFFFFPALGSGGLLLAGSLGCMAVLALVLWLSRKLQPGSMLLVGVAIAALMHGVMTLVQQSGNPQLLAVLSWLSGSTYYAQPHTVWVLVCVAVVLVALAMLFVRPLRLLALGPVVAGSLGLGLRNCQSALLLLVAVISAAATLAVGPLSFVGLMTPHLARRVGAVTPEKLLPVSALMGAGLMLLADWLGRYVIFPYELGAGVIASLLGGAYFLFLIRQRR